MPTLRHTIAAASGFCAALGFCAVAATPVFAAHLPAVAGEFAGTGVVLSVSGTCTATAGSNFSGVLRAPAVAFAGIGTFRQAVATTAQSGIYLESFPELPRATTEVSGTYQYGMAGTTLAKGQYTMSATPLDQQSFIMDLTLTYTQGDGTCTEQDRISFIRTGY